MQFSLGCILSFLVGANRVFALPSSPQGDHKDRRYIVGEGQGEGVAVPLLVNELLQDCPELFRPLFLHIMAGSQDHHEL